MKYMVISNKRFIMIGQKDDNINYDSLDTLMDLTSVEKFAFKKLRNIYDYRTNKTIFNTKTLSSSDKVRYSKGIRGLIKKKIIIRISRSGSINIMFINPDIIIPKNYDELLIEWNKYLNK